MQLVIPNPKAEVTVNDIVELLKSKELYKCCLLYYTNSGIPMTLIANPALTRFGFHSMTFSKDSTYCATTLEECLTKAMRSNSVYLLKYNEFCKIYKKK